MKAPKKIQSKKFVIAAALLLVAVVTVLAIVTKMAKDNIEESPKYEPQEAVVIITAEGFMPEVIRVRPGDSIRWINQDVQPHAVVSNPHSEHDGLPGLVSDTLAPDGEYVYVFEEAGTYEYHDEHQPEWNAVVEVGELVGD